MYCGVCRPNWHPNLFSLESRCAVWPGFEKPPVPNLLTEQNVVTGLFPPHQTSYHSWKAPMAHVRQEALPLHTHTHTHTHTHKHAHLLFQSESLHSGWSVHTLPMFWLGSGRCTWCQASALTPGRWYLWTSEWSNSVLHYPVRETNTLEYEICGDQHASQLVNLLWWSIKTWTHNNVYIYIQLQHHLWVDE